MRVKKIRADKFDHMWLIFLIVAGTTMSVVLATSIFDMTVFLSGILCVGLIAIGRREGYLIGLYNSISYSILAYGNGLYGEVYLNLLFFVPTGIIGYVMWRYHTTEDKTVKMRQLDWRQRVIIVIICTVCAVVFGVFLGLNSSQNTPFIDATTNVLSIAATFLMMWRYKEQWLFYITLNIITIVMWAFRVMDGSESADLMVLMWFLFLLNSLFGYWRWHKGVGKSTINVSTIAKGKICDVA
jgi:nicotinamide mononucleotide transporter